MINSPYGPNDLTMDRGLGWCNADSYAFFGMGELTCPFFAR